MTWWQLHQQNLLQHDLPSHECWNPEYQWQATQHITEQLFHVAQCFWMPSKQHGLSLPLGDSLICLSHIKVVRIDGDCLSEVFTDYLFMVKVEPSEPCQFRKVPQNFTLLTSWVLTSIPPGWDVLYPLSTSSIVRS